MFHKKKEKFLIQWKKKKICINQFIQDYRNDVSRKSNV